MNKEDQKIHDKLTLPQLISDGMVLQRDAVVKIWGWATSDGNVSIDFIGKTYSAKADSDGKWEIRLSGLRAGGPYCMNIKTESDSIWLRDILIGDVWLCSGQSNMELPIRRVKDFYYDEIAGACNPKIRQFKVPVVYDFNAPHEEVSATSWQEVTPDTVLEFSATGYFFAKALYERYGVPIGLLNASLGGTPVEAWISEDALKSFPEHMETAIKFRDKKLIDEIIAHDEEVTQKWFMGLEQQDKGLMGEVSQWYDYDYDDSQWSVMKIPANFDQEGIHNFNGVIWFRKDVYLPREMAGKRAKLWMGRIVDSDIEYVNGSNVGNTGYQYPPRKYDIQENILQEGKNVITIRVTCNNGHGEFIEDKPYNLYIGDETIDLKGEWKYRIGAVAKEQLPETTFIQWKPLGLYNGMIAPLLNYSIKGAIWYQGESNISRSLEYKDLFTALIEDWRQKWGQGNFPFLYVQLPNYLELVDEASKGRWPELREAQLNALSVSNTGMAVAIDAGEWNDLHPLNKKVIGKRLGLLAQKIAYGEDVVYSGPLYKSMLIEGNKIILTFSNIGGGLVAKDDKKLQQFEIAGDDKKFTSAEARIDGDKVMVWNEKVLNPAAVRYAWSDNPQSANLFNREGLPTAPFRASK